KSVFRGSSIMVVSLSPWAREVAPGRVTGGDAKNPPASRSAHFAPGLHRLLEFLGGPERDLLTGLDLDGFAGLGVSAHTRCPLAHLEDAKAGQANFGPFL